MKTLQQSLPFTVLKPYICKLTLFDILIKLQQSLPFTVLKRHAADQLERFLSAVATVLTSYGMRRRGEASRGAERR